jgi:hypothetical protein
MSRIVVFTVCLFLMTGCFIIGPRVPKPKTLYEGKISDRETISISRFEYRGNVLYNLSFNEINEGLTEYLEVREDPGFVIHKYPFGKGANSVFRMVSDTANYLRCIDFYFLQAEQNAGVLSTFVPISKKEKELFHFFAKVLADTKQTTKFTDKEADRLIGWVRIYD